MKKLEKDNAPGEVEYDPSAKKHRRYSYILDGVLQFSFGITRSTRAKSKKRYYFPKQMRLTTKEYRDLDECTFLKQDLNRRLREYSQ